MVSRRATAVFGVGIGLLAILGFLAVWAATHFSFPDTDPYWHILMGQDILAHHRLTGDPSWTFGPAGSWESTEALYEVVVYLVASAFGMKGVGVMTAVFAALLFGALGWSAYRLVPSARRAARPLVAACVAAVGFFPITWYAYTQPRPFALTVVFYALLGFVLYRALFTGRVPHPVALFFAIAGWTLVHGGSLIAMPLLVAVLVLRFMLRRMRVLPYCPSESSLRITVLAVAAGLLGTLVNPLGVGIYANAVAIKDTCIGLIFEWQHITIWSMACWLPLLVLWLAFSAGRLMTGRRRMVLVEGLYLLLVFAATASTIRTSVTALAFGAIVLARPMAAMVLPTGGGERFTRWIPWACVAAVSVVTVAGALLAPAHTARVPWPIVNGLAATQDARNVLAPWPVHGIVQWSSGANVKTYRDGRADRYGRQALLDEYRLVQSSDPKELATVLQPAMARGLTDVVTTNPTTAALLKGRGWRLVCTVPDDVDPPTYWLSVRSTGACVDGSGQPAITVPPRTGVPILGS